MKGKALRANEIYVVGEGDAQKVFNPETERFVKAKSSKGRMLLKIMKGDMPPPKPSKASYEEAKRAIAPKKRLVIKCNKSVACKTCKKGGDGPKCNASKACSKCVKK